ncbi:MAG: 33 kDa chaperonin [Firmicutes bacterium ADurb.BinA205]|nr:MAG: 33 kDa chaperonin [Firmicutes bacterium ADurb.BinA205]
MGKLYRAISADGSAFAEVLDAKDIVSEIERIHKTSAVITAGLGRLTIAASLMGYMLKGENDTITLRVDGGGPAGQLTAVADNWGNVKSCVGNPVVEIPLNAQGKLDVGGAVGTDGTLSVVKDMGLKEPYIGVVPITSGEIAEDFAYYFFTSEQIPSVVALGVLVNPDLSIKKAGGYIVQLMPGVEEEFIDALEKRVGELNSITAMLDAGLTPENIIEEIFKDIEEIEFLAKKDVAYRCRCDKDKYYRGLITLGKKDIEEMLEKDGKIEVECHFCRKKYSYTREEFQEFLK